MNSYHLSGYNQFKDCIFNWDLLKLSNSFLRTLSFGSREISHQSTNSQSGSLLVKKSELKTMLLICETLNGLGVNYDLNTSRLIFAFSFPGHQIPVISCPDSPAPNYSGRGNVDQTKNFIVQSKCCTNANT